MQTAGSAQEIEAWNYLLAWGDDAMRRTAVRGLGGCRAHSRPAVDALIDVLGDFDEEVAVGAMVSLGQLGPLAREAIPYLEDAIADAEAERLVAAARAALARIR